MYKQIKILAALLTVVGLGFIAKRILVAKTES